MPFSWGCQKLAADVQTSIWCYWLELKISVYHFSNLNGQRGYRFFYLNLLKLNPLPNKLANRNMPRTSVLRGWESTWGSVSSLAVLNCLYFPSLPTSSYTRIPGSNLTNPSGYWCTGSLRQTTYSQDTHWRHSGIFKKIINISREGTELWMNFKILHLYILCAQSYARHEIIKRNWMGLLPKIKLIITGKIEG